jgi:hypothetical protein
MLTARRMRERVAAEQAGLPPPAPRPPDEISFSQHLNEIRDLRRAHSTEVALLKAEIARLQASGQVVALPAGTKIDLVEPSSQAEQLDAQTSKPAKRR